MFHVSSLYSFRDPEDILKKWVSVHYSIILIYYLFGVAQATAHLMLNFLTADVLTFLGKKNSFFLQSFQQTKSVY